MSGFLNKCINGFCKPFKYCTSGLSYVSGRFMDSLTPPVRKKMRIFVERSFAVSGAVFLSNKLASVTHLLNVAGAVALYLDLRGKTTKAYSKVDRERLNPGHQKIYDHAVGAGHPIVFGTLIAAYLANYTVMATNENLSDTAEKCTEISEIALSASIFLVNYAMEMYGDANLHLLLRDMSPSGASGAQRRVKKSLSAFRSTAEMRAPGKIEGAVVGAGVGAGSGVGALAVPRRGARAGAGAVPRRGVTGVPRRGVTGVLKTTRRNPNGGIRIFSTPFANKVTNPQFKRQLSEGRALSP